VADEATGDRGQAQPKPFGFPAARTLDQLKDGFDDMLSGRNLRGIVLFD